MGEPWKVLGAQNARLPLGAPAIKLTRPTRAIWNSKGLLESRALLIVHGVGIEMHRMVGTAT